MEARKFGRYTVTRTLGAGAMGEVYAASDDVLGRLVAVKTLRGSASGLGQRLLDERFRHEARAIATLSHPGIVQLYDLDLSADPPFLVMEHMVGPSLAERIKLGPLPEREVRTLGIQIASALVAAHSAGIVHRDVKPANILGGGPGVWKLADFGVAHVPDSSLTMTGQFLGSPAYAPPEAVLRGQCSPAGDVFGLGAALYYAAAGCWPRASADAKGLLARVAPIRTLAPALAEDLAHTIDRALEPDPGARPTAAELAEALAAATPVRAVQLPPAAETVFVPDETALPAAVQTAFVPDLPDARRRRRRVPAIALGAGVLVLIAVVFAATRGGSPSTPGVASAGTAIDAAVPVDAALPETEPPDEPGVLRIVRPHMPEERAARDFEGVIDAIYERRYRRALERLRSWEDNWGRTSETQALERQLERLDP